MSSRPQSAPESRSRWRVRMALITTIVGVLIFFAATAVANLLITRHLARTYPPLGTMWMVEGHAMHLHCTGAGSPTILLEGGSGDDLLYWQTVQPQLSRVTRVCSYDRAGLGWSQPRGGSHDAEAVAHDLAHLLNVAAVSRPLIMVGASAGGYYVREYAREHPDEVAAVALLDSSSPQQLDELPNSRTWFTSQRQRRWDATRWEKLKVAVGWARLIGKCQDDIPEALARFRRNYAAEACRTAYVDGDLPEWSVFDVAGAQAARLISFGNVPLLVMSQDPDRPKPGWTADAITAQPIWAREQELLKNLSPKSWRVVARGAGHHVHWDRPDLVVREITSLVNYVRATGAAPPFGTTAVK
jgi:pimeloyl-ACP methyl ester carboxylesterase